MPGCTEARAACCGRCMNWDDKNPPDWPFRLWVRRIRGPVGREFVARTPCVPWLTARCLNVRARLLSWGRRASGYRSNDGPQEKILIPARRPAIGCRHAFGRAGKSRSWRGRAAAGYRRTSGPLQDDQMVPANSQRSRRNSFWTIRWECAWAWPGRHGEPGSPHSGSATVPQPFDAIGGRFLFWHCTP